MNDLRELYQEIIIDHNQNPRNHHVLDDATCCAKGFNPLCGDKLTVYLHVENDVITKISFLGEGCAISQASASLMTEILQGKSIKEAHQLFERMHHMLTVEDDPDVATLGKLSVMAGVRTFPARVKCATLAWHTLENALKKDSKTASTE